MKKTKDYLTHAGFASWELLVLVVVLAVIVGAGSYVYLNHGKKEATKVTSSSNAPAQQKSDEAVQLGDNEINAESSAYGTYDSQASSNAVSDSTAMTNLGGASDDTGL